MIRHQECQLKRLLLVQPRVAEASVVGAQIILIQARAATQTLRDRIARKLQVHTAQVRPLLLVDTQRLLQLREDIAELACLDTARHGLRVAVHGIALPDDGAGVLRVFDGADVCRQEGGDLAGAVTRDERDLAGLAVGVQGAQHGKQVSRRGGRADLHADGVGDAAEVFNVCVVDLACAVADPEEVGRGVVVFLLGRGGRFGRVGAGRGVVEQASQRFFVLEKQTLVRGEELDGRELLVLVGANGMHETEHFLNAVNGYLVLGFEGRVANVAETPVERAVEVGDAGADGAADVVERGGRVVVGTHKTVGVQLALVGVEAVEDIATERGHLLAVNSLDGGRTRLRVLTSHAADTHDGLVGAPEEDEGHLQKQLDLGLDHILLAIAEELGAIATLQEEGLALSDIAKVFAETDDLVGEDEGREVLELVNRFFKGGLVWVVGALLDGLGSPRVGRPFGDVWCCLTAHRDGFGDVEDVCKWVEISEPKWHVRSLSPGASYSD